MVSAGLPVVARDARFPRADPVDGETLERRAASSARCVTEAKWLCVPPSLSSKGAGLTPWCWIEQLKAAYKRLAPDTRGCSSVPAPASPTLPEPGACLAPLEMAVPGGRAGHDLEPVARAGCYAPGGNYPLPSSVLMTAATARAAGVGSVVVASPSSDDLMLGAAWLAGADEFLHAGGAHAIAALSYGFEGFDAVDFVAGPGNRWVTAAKAVVIGRVGVDMLAGPLSWSSSPMKPQTRSSSPRICLDKLSTTSARSTARDDECLGGAGGVRGLRLAAGSARNPSGRRRLTGSGRFNRLFQPSGAHRRGQPLRAGTPRAALRATGRAVASDTALRRSLSWYAIG